LTRRVSVGELLVLLVCWKSGPYGVPDQQGDRHDSGCLVFSCKDISLSLDIFFA
jgi:hypothetical protein